MPRYLTFVLICCLLTSCGTDAEGQLPEPTTPELTLALTVSTEIPTDEKVSGSLRQNLNGEVSSYPMRIERRGGFSIGYPKHSYEIDLEEDVLLGGMAVDDDWILNANYIDKTFLRHYLSYELFRSMGPNNRAAECSFTRLELNGQYQGLYVLMQKLDRSSLNVPKGDGGFIFKEPHLFRDNYDGVDTLQRGGNFQQQTYPKYKKQDFSPALAELRALILRAEDTDFDDRIRRVVDIDNLLDWHLLLLISNNQDGLLKNFYLYRETAEAPVRFAPWDYDHSFGRDGDGERNLNERQVTAERNILFRRLLQRPWYRTRLRERWQALQDAGTLRAESIITRIDELATMIGPLAKENFTRWPVDTDVYYDAADFATEIRLMKDFVLLRQATLDQYFLELEIK